MKKKHLIFSVLFLVSNFCFAQNKDIEFKKLNTWQDVPIIDDFGDRNGSYKVIYSDDITDTISLVYIYDYGDYLIMNSYYTFETGYGKRYEKVKLSSEGWSLKIKREDNSIESYQINILEDRASFRFDRNSPIYSLIKSNSDENLKFALYYYENLNSSFSIKSQ